MASGTRELKVTVTGDDRDVRRMFDRVGKGTSGVERGFTRAAAAVGLFGGAGYGLSRVLQGTIGAAGDLERQMSAVGAASGGSKKELEALRGTALKFGQSSVFSARQVAEAETELAKAGRTAAQIIGGDLSGALLLAQAGNVGIAESATYVANTMGLFGRELKDVNRVADAFTVAANTTTADVKDFGDALVQGGGAAAAAGLDFTNTMVILEALAKVGTKGSDAGTSLKTALVKLVNPTAAASKVIREYGLNFETASGKLKDGVQIAGMLREKLSGLTATQRAAALQTLAGTDGFRVLLALYEAGAAKTAAWRRQLDQSGVASRQAAQLSDNYNSKLKTFQNSVEVAGIKLGTKFLPAFTDLITTATAGLNKVDIGKLGDEIASGFTAAGDVIGPFVPLVKAAGAVIAGLAGPMRTVIGLAGDFAGTPLGRFALTTAAAVAVARKLAGSGAAAGLLGGKAAGVLGVQRVYVVNLPPLGGAGGAAGGAGGAVSRVGRFAGAGAAALPGAAGIAALAGAGIGFQALTDRGKLPGVGGLFPSKATRAVEGSEFQRWIVEAYRESATKGWAAFTQSSRASVRTAFVFDRTSPRESITKALDVFQEAATKVGPRARAAGASVAAQAAAGLGGLSGVARIAAADGMVRMAAELEAKGKLPRGTADKVVNAIEAAFGRLPAITRASAASAATGFEAQMLRMARAVGGPVAALAGLIEKIQSIPAARTFTTIVKNVVRGVVANPSGGKPGARGEKGRTDPFAVFGLRAAGTDPGLTVPDRVGLGFAYQDRADVVTRPKTVAAAVAAAKAGGTTNPDRLALIGDLAELKYRKSRLDGRRGVVLNAFNTVDRGIKKLERDRAAAVNARRGLPQKTAAQKKAFQKASDDIGRITAQIDVLYGQRAALRREGADIIAEADDLGYQITGVTDAINRTPNADAVAAEPYSAGEADLALAGLTTDQGDDLAALTGLQGTAERELQAALGSGDPTRIREAATALRGYRDAAATIVEAQRPAAAAAAPSAGGPMVVQNIYPAGVAADDPRALMAAASWFLRSALVGAA